MYKCLECGNTYKFVGTVREEGNAFIYQNSPDNYEKESNYNEEGGNECNATSDSLTWAFMTSDGQWKCSHDVTRCFYCNSNRIGKV